MCDDVRMIDGYDPNMKEKHAILWLDFSPAATLNKEETAALTAIMNKADGTVEFSDIGFSEAQTTYAALFAELPVEDEQPAEDDGYYDEQSGEEYDEYYDDYEPEYKTNVFLAILYTIGAIIVGVPVFAVLLVLDLAVLAIGAVCGAAGVSLIMTAFIGLPMVADMLILLGGGAAVIAIALVVIWLAVWLFIRMVIGWVRLLVRLGHRWCRKEIAA